MRKLEILESKPSFVLLRLSTSLISALVLKGIITSPVFHDSFCICHHHILGFHTKTTRKRGYPSIFNSMLAVCLSSQSSPLYKGGLSINPGQQYTPHRQKPKNSKSDLVATLNPYLSFLRQISLSNLSIRYLLTEQLCLPSKVLCDSEHIYANRVLQIYA